MVLYQQTVYLYKLFLLEVDLVQLTFEFHCTFNYFCEYTAQGYMSILHVYTTCQD